MPVRALGPHAQLTPLVARPVRLEHEKQNDSYLEEHVPYLALTHKDGLFSAMILEPSAPQGGAAIPEDVHVEFCSQGHVFKICPTGVMRPPTGKLRIKTMYCTGGPSVEPAERRCELHENVKPVVHNDYFPFVVFGRLTAGKRQCHFVAYLLGLSTFKKCLKDPAYSKNNDSALVYDSLFLTSRKLGISWPLQRRKCIRS